MIPGIWLEIEVMGTQCALAKTTDKSWFFQRHGTVVLDRDRYQLDFRNPDVRAYTRSVIDRLIQEYGIGYFKIDYNINAYTRTEYQADSAGDGLLEHNRAYLSWLDEIFAEYPDIVIENCSSGDLILSSQRFYGRTNDLQLRKLLSAPHPSERTYGRFDRR